MSKVTITIVAKTMDGLGAVDPELTVKIDEAQPIQKPLGISRVPNFTNQISLTMDGPEASGPTWMVTPNFSRFMVSGGLFFMPLTEPNKTFTVQLVRVPSAWQARFTKYASLASPRFDRFKAVVGVSKDVDLKVPKVPAVGDLEANYDAIDLEPQILGKAALLNLYSVLTEEIDPFSDGGGDGGECWFSYVKEIVRIDQERFIAEVEKDLFDHVKKMVAGLGGQFPHSNYATEPDGGRSQHTVNIPKRYNCPENLAEMVTIKKGFEQGNVQLTAARLGTGEYLLDCDMDDHLNIVAHSGDVVIHAVEEDVEHSPTAGTHPYLMHEYIVRDSAQQSGGVATVDLGYVLV
jgi:hypothetical protein